MERWPPLIGQNFGGDKWSPAVAGYPPGQDLLGEPIHHVDQIDEATAHRDVDYVGRPNLVRPFNGQVPQQVAVDGSPGGLFAGVGLPVVVEWFRRFLLAMLSPHFMAACAVGSLSKAITHPSGRLCRDFSDSIGHIWNNRAFAPLRLSCHEPASA